MARIFPEDYLETQFNWIYPAEYKTLMFLQDQLSDQYEIFHGVHWTNIHGRAIYGEIDFLVLHPNGRLLAIEQKNIEIEQYAGQLLVRYQSSDKAKNIISQITRNISNLRTKFSKIHPDLNLQVDHLLYLPTAIFNGDQTINVGRVVDSRQSEQLHEIIMEMMETASTDLPSNMPDYSTLRDFLLAELKLQPNLDVLSAKAKEVTTFMARGLSEWVDQIQFEPFRLYIHGTAGSGKTQLALSELERADQRNLYGYYLCFNRPLKERIREYAPQPQYCLTFHELAKNMVELVGGEVDFSNEAIFSELENSFLLNADKFFHSLDFLLVDEGQDFKSEWISLLLQMVKPEGRIIWMEDTSQSIYPDRQAYSWQDWLQFNSVTNYRSPRVIVDFINELSLSNQKIVSANPIEGEPTYLKRYDKSLEGDVLHQTELVVYDLLAQGYQAENIAIISFLGAKRSYLLNSNQNQIAGKSIKKVIGYDSQHQLCWSDGELLIDTIYRFKGLSADAIVLTELDFNEWNPQVKRKLFVAMTRARIKVILVASAAADKLISDSLQY